MFPVKTSILICDDSYMVLKNIKASLNALGYTKILEAADGDQGYQKLLMAEKSEAPVGLIICDWLMPKLNGLDFLLKIREVGSFSKIPFILLTAQNEMNQVMNAALTGVDGYIIKPIENDKLKAQLDKTWKMYQSKK